MFEAQIDRVCGNDWFIPENINGVRDRPVYSLLSS